MFGLVLRQDSADAGPATGPGGLPKPDGWIRLARLPSGFTAADPLLPCSGVSR
jgi:hypothetical protein